MTGHTTIISVDTLSLRTDAPADPEAMLAQAELLDGLVKRNLAVSEQSFREQMLFGIFFVQIDEDGSFVQIDEDGAQYWMDRVRETGNAVVTLIPQLIAEAYVAANRGR